MDTQPSEFPGTLKIDLARPSFSRINVEQIPKSLRRGKFL